MKAVRVNAWAQPVTLEEIPQPEPGEGEVLVRVRAVSLNPIDLFVLKGFLQGMMNVPLTLGTDFAGEVESVGAGVGSVAPGDAVYGFGQGTLAEYVVVKGDAVARRPSSIDANQSAALPLAGLTAWQSLFDLARLKPDEHVLIHGAGGGVGTFAVQMAKNAGARVTGTDRGTKEAHLRGLGVDRYIDNRLERFEDVAGTVDVVLDLVGGELIGRSVGALSPGARYVTPAAMPDQIPTEEAEHRGVIVSTAYTQSKSDGLTRLAELVDAGRLKVFLNQTFPLDETQAALNYKEQTSDAGKVVVTLDR